MKKSGTFSLIFLASSALLASNVFAQTSPTSGAAQTPAAKPQSSTGTAAAKPQAGTAAKKPGTASTAKPGAAAPALTTDRDKASYAIGANIGKSMKKEGVDLDPAIVARGMKDGFSGGKLLLTDEQAQAALVAFSAAMKKREEVHLAAIGAANQKQGEAFLAANKSKAGIVTLPSGLQYKILATGTGPKPTTEDTILCNYRGTLLNGTEFDASEKHGGPATIPVGGVIKGWTEALQLMPVGSKWELYIPPDLAYGNRQAGPDIGPNSTLIFNVELVSIQEKPKDAPADPAKAVAPNAAPATPQPQAAPQPTPPAPQPAPKPPSL